MEKYFVIYVNTIPDVGNHVYGERIIHRKGIEQVVVLCTGWNMKTLNLCYIQPVFTIVFNK